MDEKLLNIKIFENEDKLDYEAVQAIVNTLTDEKYKSDHLKLIGGLQQMFNKCVPTLEDKLMRHMDIETLLDLTASADKGATLENESECLDYVIFLLNLMKYDKKFHKRVGAEITKYIGELLKKREYLPDPVVRNIWYTLEKSSVLWPELIEVILPSSKLFIEDRVLQWADVSNADYDTVKLKIKYFAEASAECKSLFQTISSVLNQILCLTQGNKSILNLISHFVNAVSEYCDKNEKTIARLYPRDYCLLISLLIIPPDMYIETSSDMSETVPLKTEVLQLIAAKFNDDKDMMLLLLSHYPQWLKQFTFYLSGADKDQMQ